VESALAKDPNGEFHDVVASKIQGDAIGVVAKTDHLILLIGERLHFSSKKKQEKAMESRQNTMSAMRLLARIVDWPKLMAALFLIEGTLGNLNKLSLL
jgi:hypothetical protein